MSERQGVYSGVGCSRIMANLDSIRAFNLTRGIQQLVELHKETKLATLLN